MTVTRVCIPRFVDLGAHAFPGKPSQPCARTRGGWTRGCRSEPQRNRAGWLYEDGRINQINSFKHLIPEAV